MPIIKHNEILPERSIIMVLYGVPGSGKTSVAATANNPVLIDTDRGFDRAVRRIDTSRASAWEDILNDEASFDAYDTIIIDTAKATLDDYLVEYVCRLNYKLKTNSLKRFGEIADQFKGFVNRLRLKGKDIIFICHDKEEKDGDIIKHSPDCTGQSKDLLIRIADQVGYIGIQNKQRVITFEPLDNFVGKNVAQLDTIVIPNAPSKEFDTCMADIIKQVKSAIQSKSEAQRKAQEQLAELREKINEVETMEDVDAILKMSKDLPKIMKVPFFSELKETLSAKGFSYDDKNKKFVKDEQTDSQGNDD